MQIAEANLERVRQGNTAQGFYVLDSGGTFYGYNNNRSVERVTGLLDRASVAFRDAKTAGQAPTEAEMKASRGPEAPAGTTRVRVFTRIRPVPAGAADANRRVNRDHLWISQEEVAALAAGQAGGKTFPVPPTLARRIARFHLVDNVRGEPDMWTSPQVHSLELTARPSGAGLDLGGAFVMKTENGDRGFEGTFEGRLTFDAKAARLTSFQAIAQGTAWGASTYCPDPPKGRFPVVVAFIDAEDAMSRKVAPQGLLWVPEYWRP